MATEKLEVAPSFCYLGDCLSSDGGRELVSIKRCRVAWGTEFNELLLISASRLFPHHLQSLQFGRQERHVPYKGSLGHQLIWFASLARQWPAMIHRKCGVTNKNQVSSQNLLGMMKLDDLEIGYHSTPMDSNSMTISKVVMVCWRRSRNDPARGGPVHSRPKETLSDSLSDPPELPCARPRLDRPILSIRKLGVV